MNAEREQTVAERVIQGVTGTVQLISTGFGILGIGTAIGTKAGLITPKIPGPAALNPGVIEAELAEPAILAERAAQYHSVLDPIAQKQRTTAALGTDGGTIIGGGVRDLSPAQRALQKEGEILAKLPGEHAEITVLQEAAKRGLRPSALESTRDFCSGCMQALIDAGATITGSRSAVWSWRK